MPEFKLYEISLSDFDAAKKYMANIAENVKYTRKVHKNAILSAEDVALWTNLWLRWLALGNKLNTDLKDRPLMERIIVATSPALQASRYLWSKLHVGMMSEPNKRQFDALLKEAHILQDRFKLAGMSQVAIPYMGDLVSLLRGLPPEMTIPQMIDRLRATAKVGERLLDENTPWSAWRLRADAKPLRLATAEAKQLADRLAAILKEPAPTTGIADKVPPGAGTRDKFTPIYQLVTRTLASIYIEAAGLYGVEETKATAEADLGDALRNAPKKAGISLLWLLGTVGLGYLGSKWLTRKKETVVIVEASGRPGYHPDQEHRAHAKENLSGGTESERKADLSGQIIDLGSEEEENEFLERESQGDHHGT